MADKTGKGGLTPWDPQSSNFDIHVSAATKDPVLAFRFLDYLMYEPEAYFVQMYGPRIGTDWIYVTGQGKTDKNGNPADVQVLEDVRLFVNDYVWKGGGKGLATLVSAADASNKTEIEIYKDNYQKLLGENVVKAGQPAEEVKKLLYNAEEQEIYSEYFGVLKDTMTQWRGEFISGAKDINSDADWNAYKAALEAEGLKEVIAVAQSCYTRMMG